MNRAAAAAAGQGPHTLHFLCNAPKLPELGLYTFLGCTPEILGKPTLNLFSNFAAEKDVICQKIGPKVSLSCLVAFCNSLADNLVAHTHGAHAHMVPPQRRVNTRSKTFCVFVYLRICICNTHGGRGARRCTRSISDPRLFVYLCICICVFVYLCICVFVYLQDTWCLHRGSGSCTGSTPDPRLFVPRHKSCSARRAPFLALSCHFFTQKILAMVLAAIMLLQQCNVAMFQRCKNVNFDIARNKSKMCAKNFSPKTKIHFQHRCIFVQDWRVWRSW